MPPPDSLRLPAGRSGRLLALVLLCVFAAVVVMGIVMPIAGYWNDLTDELDHLQSQVNGYQRLVARQSAVSNQLTQIRADLTEAADYLTEANPAIAAAEAQRDLSALAETSGVDVRTTLTLPPTTAEGFTSIGFQLSVSGSLRSLRNFLYGIEAGKPRLIVDRLLVRPSQTSEADAASGIHDMSLDLHGYMQAGATP